MKKSFSIKNIITLGWKTFKENPKLFVATSLMYVIVSIVPSIDDLIAKHVTFLADDPIYTILSLCINIAVFILGFIIPIGYTYILLEAVDNGSFEFRDLFSTKGVFWKFFLTGLLSFLIVGVGFALLIIPGIFFSITLMFASYVVVDEKLRPVDAIKRSHHLTEGVRWKLAGFVVAILGLNLLGAAFFGLGILVTMPVSGLASVHLYRSLKHQEAEILVRSSESPMTVSS